MKSLKFVSSMALLGLGVAATAQAEIIPLKLTPGLWEQTSAIVVNGQNLEQMMFQMREQMMAKMKPEERAILQQNMPSMAENPAAGKHLDCLTPAYVAKGIDTEQFRKQLESSAKQCDVRLLSASASGGKYEMNCKIPNGGTQKAVGEYVVKSDKEWTYHAVANGDMQGAPAGTKYQSTIDLHGVWKGANCGKVRPVAEQYVQPQ